MDDEITLISKNKKDYPVERKYAYISGKIKQICNKNQKITDPVLLLEINDENLDLIVQFLKYLKGEPSKEEIKKPIQTNNLSHIVTDQFMVEFIERMTITKLFEITEIANFLEIECLIDLCTVKIACLCFNKNEEELFKELGIQEKFTDEERAKIKEENKWIEGNL